MTTLLATDFDGTVAAIVTDPAAARMDDAARAFLEEVSRRDDVEVAFLSGRDLDDLAARTEGIRAYRSGSHGRELRGPDGAMLRAAEPWSGDVPPSWRDAASRAGIRIERKRFGVAAHWRGVEGVDRAHPLIGEFVAWARGAGLHAIEGRAVVEATLPGPAKADVLAAIAAHCGAERVVYAGDDLTDFGAIAWAAKRGVGIFVRSGERREELPPDVLICHTREEVVAIWQRTLSK